ncbi:MAG: hypothetical protein HY665_08245 [Chloroflexi bacterium]|nr:hypothetical protein [Chloroflexota bacterium]
MRRNEKIGERGEVVEVDLPAVVTVRNEMGTPRYPAMKGIMEAGYRRSDTQPYVMTIQACAYDPASIRQGYQGRVVRVTAKLPASVVVHTRVVEQTMTSGPKVEDATILVSGGPWSGQERELSYQEAG